jgi:pyroglutamyl-peptidase
MSARPVILLTGFEPFGGAASNPSWDAVQRVAANWSGTAKLHTARLPTAFATSGERLGALIDLLKPDIVLCVGLAQGRAAVTPELIAINRIDARIPDNAGSQPRDASVVPGGPDGLFATLPVKAMVAAMRTAGVPASLSYSAGTFVCNSTFYALMHALSGSQTRGGFIHVPATPAETVNGDCPTMSLDHIVAALEAALSVCLIDKAHASIDAGTIA